MQFDKKRVKISFVGSGAVASFLATELLQQGICINQVWSRKLTNAIRLADIVNANPIDNLANLDFSDIIIVAIVDDYIEEVVCKLPSSVRKDSLIVHTSGITSIEVLAQCCDHYGLFYPLNTFKIGNQPASKDTPFYINAKNDEGINLLTQIAQILSPKVYHINDTQRKKLHIAAVFASNFSNACYNIAEDILHEAELDLSHLHPLIQQTTDKIVNGISPFDAQTGPAQRGDKDTIKEHLDLLTDEQKYRIYDIMSHYIQSKHSK